MGCNFDCCDGSFTCIFKIKNSNLYFLSIIRD